MSSPMRPIEPSGAPTPRVPTPAKAHVLTSRPNKVSVFLHFVVLEVLNQSRPNPAGEEAVSPVPGTPGRRRLDKVNVVTLVECLFLSCFVEIGPEALVGAVLITKGA